MSVAKSSRVSARTWYRLMGNSLSSCLTSVAMACELSATRLRVGRASRLRDGDVTVKTAYVAELFVDGGAGPLYLGTSWVGDETMWPRSTSAPMRRGSRLCACAASAWR